eukprot:427791-Amphidinium_carterae.2
MRLSPINCKAVTFTCVEIEGGVQRVRRNSAHAISVYSCLFTVAMVTTVARFKARFGLINQSALRPWPGVGHNDIMILWGTCPSMLRCSYCVM